MLPLLLVLLASPIACSLQDINLLLDESSKFELHKFKPRGFALNHPLSITPHVLPIIRSFKEDESEDLGADKPPEAAISSIRNGDVYVSPIILGDQSLFVVIDTGSSDTWVVGKLFKCFKVATKARVPNEKCLFGPGYSKTSTFQTVPNKHFKVSYADGEFLRGTIGRENITFAGVTVSQQVIGVAENAAWMGDGKSSGLMGLAYPKVMSIWSGNSSNRPESDHPNKNYDPTMANIEASPIFTTMWEQGLIPPVFSIGLGRGNDNGVLALGGIPGSTSKYSSDFVTTDIIITGLKPKLSSKTNLGDNAKPDPNLSLYTVRADSYSIGGDAKVDLEWSEQGPNRTILVGSKQSDMETIIDSGTTLIYVPEKMAKQINEEFVPSAEYSRATKIYLVNCDAKPPKFGIDIGGQTFWIHPRDMIRHTKVERGKCMSSVQPTVYGSLNILGDVFLKNVLAVFDVGASQMRFAARL